MFAQIATIICAAAMTLSLYMEAGHFLQRAQTSIVSAPAPAPAPTSNDPRPPPH